VARANPYRDVALQRFEIGVAGAGGEASLVFDRDHYPNRFALGLVSSLEVIATRTSVAFVLDGTLNKVVKWTAGPVDRLFISARRSQFRLLDIRVRAGENGAGPVLVRGPFIAEAGGLARTIGILALALLGATALLLIELGLARLLRVEIARVLASWLAIATPVAVGVWLAVHFRWLGSYLAPLPLAWLFFRVRFWLIAGSAFAQTRTGTWRFVVALGGLVSVAVVVFYAVRFGAGWGVVGAGAVAAISAGLTAAMLSLFARDLGLRFRDGAAVAGPAFLPLVVTSIFAIVPDGRSALATLLPLSLLTLSFPLSTHRRALRRYGLMMLLVALLAITGVELGLRFSRFASYLRPLNVGKTFEPDRDLFWAPKGLFGDSGNWLQREDLHVRRIAFRGREDEPAPRPPGVTRILVLGGSNVWGDGQPTNETTFSGLLETRLHKRGLRAEVLNGGVKGYNSFQVMVLLTRYALAYKPDIVVLYLARNDLAQDTGLFTYRELWKHAQSNSYRALTSLQEQLRRSLLYNGLTRVFVDFRARLQGRWYDPKLWKPVNPMADFKQNLIDAVDAAQHAGARVLLVTEFWGEPFLTPGGANNGRLVELLQTMRDVAREKNAPLLDAWRYFASTDDPLHWVLREDPVHFNAEGHAELARLLEQFLTQNRLLP
jgi:lysophospholipase L1-like esterase